MTFVYSCLHPIWRVQKGIRQTVNSVVIVEMFYNYVQLLDVGDVGL